jgi:hypothetical protein
MKVSKYSILFGDLYKDGVKQICPYKSHGHPNGDYTCDEWCPLLSFSVESDGTKKATLYCSKFSVILEAVTGIGGAAVDFFKEI